MLRKFLPYLLLVATACAQDGPPPVVVFDSVWERTIYYQIWEDSSQDSTTVFCGIVNYQDSITDSMMQQFSIIEIVPGVYMAGAMQTDSTGTYWSINPMIMIQDQLCADLDGDGLSNIADLVYLIDYLFRGGECEP